LNKNSQSIDNKELSENGNSERVQNRVHKSAISLELEQIITVWSELSTEQKKAILNIINKLQ
jgi:hypothetical protein